MVENIKWLGHDSFKIKGGGKIIYIDPWKIGKEEKAEGARQGADLILVTHEHFDHFSKEDVEKLQGPNTVVVTTEVVAKDIKGDVKILKHGEKTKVGEIEIEAVPAYNVKKERLNFHPKKNNGLGFIFHVEGFKIYHTGDTDYIPEMDNLKAEGARQGIDIALIPVSGTYVMTAEEAAEAALKIKPKLAIPMHYGDIVGSKKDAEKFRDLLKGKIEVKILEPLK